MTEQLATLIVTASANLALGVVVFYKAPGRGLNRSFAGLSLTISAWTLSNGLVSTYAQSPFGIIWARAAFASASLIPVSFLLFVMSFPSSKVRRATRSVVVAFALAGLSGFVFSLTPLIAKHTSAADGVLKMSYGPLHPLFGIYMVGCLGYTLYLLARELRLSKGLERQQLSYVFLGIFLTATGGTVTNLIIPMIFHSSRFSPYGPVFTLFMVGLVAHSIIRHRLMDIRVVIRRGATYLLSIGLAGAAFAALVWTASSLLTLQARELPIAAQLALALLIAIVFPPLKARIQRWMDRYLFREPYDYQKTLRDISRALASTLDLRSLLTLGSNIITRTLRPEFVAVYAADPTDPEHTFRLEHETIGVTQRPQIPSLSSSLHLIKLLSTGVPHVLLDELRTSTRNQDVVDDLISLGADLAVAITQEDRLIGFFLLGAKLSSDPYFSEDIDLLTTLAGQTGIAIKNAQLYSQVVLVNEYVENILANMDSAVIAVSVAGIVILSNAAAAKLTPSTTSLNGSSLSHLPAAIATPLKLTLSDGQPRWQFETTLTDRDGNLKLIICSTSPLKDRGGATLGAVVVFSDLTHLKQLEDEKRQAERLASVGALASGIAHEIKNPLVAIKTFAELLPERFSDDEFRNDFSRVVTREIERIDDLVARLRDLAIPPTRQLSLIDLRSPIEETLALLRGQLEQAEIAVKTDCSPDMPFISGDHAQLKQLFLNLFLNALEAMTPGGQLSIRLHSRQTADGFSVFAEVADTGCGIPESLINRIFDPFVTTKPTGSGLGLSICRGITDAHRAKIRAENNPAGGTKIVVQFPVLNEVSVRA